MTTSNILYHYDNRKYHFWEQNRNFKNKSRYCYAFFSLLPRNLCRAEFSLPCIDSRQFVLKCNKRVDYQALAFRNFTKKYAKIYITTKRDAKESQGNWITYSKYLRISHKTIHLPGSLVSLPSFLLASSIGHEPMPEFSEADLINTGQKAGNELRAILLLAYCSQSQNILTYWKFSNILEIASIFLTLGRTTNRQHRCRIFAKTWTLNVQNVILIERKLQVICHYREKF